MVSKIALSQGFLLMGKCAKGFTLINNALLVNKANIEIHDIMPYPRWRQVAINDNVLRCRGKTGLKSFFPDRGTLNHQYKTPVALSHQWRRQSIGFLRRRR